MARKNALGYNGSLSLKKAGTKIQWTPDLIEEYLKCRDDPIYFAEKYIKIVNIDEGFIPIKLYDYQKEIIEKIHNNRKVAVNASRQCGKTTTATVIILHYVIFEKHKDVFILGNKRDTAVEVLSRIQQAYEALPMWLQQGVVVWNKSSIELENGCSITAAATSASAIRGRSCAFLYIDEAAFIDNYEEFAASVLPTIASSKTAKLMYTSTPFGLNHYAKICRDAVSGTSDFKYVEIPWQRVPGRDEKWRNAALADLNFDLDRFSQEYECEFMGSSGTLISGATLKNLIMKTPIWQDEGFSQYEAAHPEKKYVLIGDTSQGKGLDYSAFHIIDITQMPYKQVCVYRSNQTPPDEYAEVVHRASKIYNDCAILMENNDMGGVGLNTLYNEFLNEGLMYTTNNGRNGKTLSPTGGELGIRQSVNTKRVGCSMLKLLVEQHKLELVDSSTIYELSRFSKKSNTYAAEPGCTDDLSMGLVVFGWLTEQDYFKELTDINTLKALREKSEEDYERDFMPIYIERQADPIIHVDGYRVYTSYYHQHAMEMVDDDVFDLKGFFR